MWTSPQADAIGGFLDHIPLLGQLKQYCERGGVMEDMANLASSIKDKATDMVASVKDSATNMVATVKEKVSPSQEPEVAVAEKGHGIGLSAQRMAAIEGNAGGVGTRAISEPEQATYASLCSGMNMNTQGIQCDQQQNFSTADLGNFSVNTGRVQTQQQGMAMG